MNRELILKALIDWNFWYKTQFTGYPRDDYVKKVLSVINSWYVASILGVKRAGKSTILNQVAKKLIQSGIDPFDIFIINFEDGRLTSVQNVEDLFKLYEIYLEIRRRKDTKPYVFLDEIQRVNGWEGFVRSLIDRKEAFIIVSGSTSDLINENVRKKLAGRHVIINVYPLSFKEFLDFKGLSLRNETDLIAKEPEIKAYFNEYLSYGGFPGIVNSNVKEQLLLSLYEDILTKDVIASCKIKEVDKLRILSLYYISNTGNRIKLRNISRQLQIPLRTVQRFTQCLIRAKLLYFVNPLSPNLSVMSRAERKVYVVDQGLANVIGYRLNSNLGSLLENLVFIELVRRYGEDNIFYYRGKKGEVDFVIKERNSVREAYQVTYYLNEREYKGAKELLKWDIPTIFLTFDEEGEVKINGKSLKVLKVWKWLLSI
ncbi:ATP-binding protein [Saccharolobus islandicus]|uniref:Putative ATPase (AAA+ superfamily) n=1 Tax=Saccharolobus islandicus LAL14/1 TaxID=1241935 RepID=M9UCS8_SACIS|nr:ATP-binding protein [Sulfolobus islandicus]AGJ61965.1 putative ATPase (AAA+ superfamily) [Sulfolobus islandicus LAL14/1]